MFVCFLGFPCLFHFPSINISLVPAASHSEHAHGPWRDEPKWTSSSASPWSQHALWGHGQQWASSTTHTQSDEWANAWWVDASLPSLTPKIPTSCFPSLLLSPPFPPVFASLVLPSNTTELWGRTVLLNDDVIFMPALLVQDLHSLTVFFFFVLLSFVKFSSNCTNNAHCVIFP